MGFKIRNAANSAWIDLSAANTKIRNAANSGWITMSGSNLKIRNMVNTAWITDAPPVPDVTTTSAFSTIMDVSGNGDHTTVGGKPYGLWVDGPIYPYKGSDGVHRFTVPHSENYMFTVPDWNNGASWGLSHVYDSPRQAPEGSYNNRHWLFGKYALADGTIYGLAHHEWYQTMGTYGGVPGFNGYGSPNRRWVNAVKWMKSLNNGASWAQKGNLSSQDLVCTPEPWGTQSRDTLFGYFHPSNIVKEGSYYYAFMDSRQLRGGTNLLECGFVMMRTTDLENAVGWEFWNGTGWTASNPFSYLGGQGPQQPYVFFKVTGNDPYTTDPGSISMAQAIRYHVPTEQWLLFGSDSRLASCFCYCASETLATPQFEDNGVRQASLAGGGIAGDYATYGGAYVSVFDPASTDINFERIEGSTAIVFVAQSFVRYRKQTISIA